MANFSGFQCTTFIHFLFASVFIIAYLHSTLSEEFDDVLVAQSKKIQRSTLDQPKSYNWLLEPIANRGYDTISPEATYQAKTMKAMLKLPIRPGLVHFSSVKPKTLPQLQRKKRNYENLVRDVCPSISDWVAREEAYDPYGNKLTIVQRIPVNGTYVNQYFYETFCANNYVEFFEEYNDFFGSEYYKKPEDMQCLGVDKKSFKF
ncbi:uncharacterized protein B4U79_05467 [Dinothrombium tinctorium]|uniref:Nerve growth factor-related domain-containing protein n=1 Tax=Dinothrombium tinctorium TaxID=1965070 RepID=A0A443RPQ2_9ACAR|nr:uncharacterized protein B4U79_05467 [Dinothrombium tinctorium]